MARRIDLVGVGGEQHFRLEDETIANHADVRAVAEDLVEAAEEVGPIERQLLDLLGEGDIEALAEIGDLRLVLLVLLLRDVEVGLDGRQLLAQRVDLLIEQVDLGQRLLADLLLACRGSPTG